MAALYSVEPGGAVALTTTVAKTVLAAINSSGGLIRLVEWGLGFDGATASAVPALIELGSLSTTTAGTATAITPVQVKGPTRTVQFTAKKTYTAEPTTITTVARWTLHQQAGMVVQYPLGREPEQWTSSYALVLRVTAAFAGSLNCHPYMVIEEG